MLNIKHVTETVRVELAQLWAHCFHNQGQRQAFAPYHSGDHTENLLHLHELIWLRNYYEVHKELFEGVQEWQESWKFFLEFERKTSDPSRFKNRGANLLKEEKERAKLQKTLLKLAEELKARIDKWEREQSLAFVVNGQKFMEYITEQWELHRLGKERVRQQKRLKNEKQTETEMLHDSAPRIPSKRPSDSQRPGEVTKSAVTSMCSGKKNLELPGSGPTTRTWSSVAHPHQWVSGSTPLQHPHQWVSGSTPCRTTAASSLLPTPILSFRENFQRLPDLMQLLKSSIQPTPSPENPCPVIQLCWF
ncbi:hypothetical protein STEG23_013815 [Scotinomys teguina]